MEENSLTKVAAIQLQGRPGDFESNLSVAQQLAESAFDAGAMIVALPEFFPSPVYYDAPFQSHALDAKANPALAMMQELARRYRGFIGGSMIVHRESGCFNSYYFVQPDGRFFTHDKDLPTMWENCFYDPGQDDGLMETAVGGVGAAVCWELIRTQTIKRLRGRIGLAMTGNHWWTVPSNWPLLTPLLSGVDRLNRGFAEQAPVEFARHLGVPVLHAAQCGRFRSRFLLSPGIRLSVAHESEFVGATQIVAANGAVVASRNTREGPGIVMGEIQIGAITPAVALDESRYWIPELTGLHRAYWHQQNACGKWFRRTQIGSVRAT